MGSAGTHALTGNRPTHEAMEAGRLAGLVLSSHRARQVDELLMLENDVILGMTQRHHAWLRREFPQYKNKIYLALLFPEELAGEDPQVTDVPDPIGESVKFYINVLEMLRPALPKIARGALGEEIT